MGRRSAPIQKEMPLALRPQGRSPGWRQSDNGRWNHATSRHAPHLNPTRGKVPMDWNPTARCNPTLASFGSATPA